jgi:8-oxo-dGTP diphosphatase
MQRGIDYTGVGVGAIIVDDQGRLFCALRGPLAKNERGKWEFPGGAVEFGETLANALRREMLEEYGIRIEVGQLLDVIDHILPQENQHWVSPTFVCNIIEGTPAIREAGKCLQIAWFYPDQVPSNLTAASRSSFDDYKVFLTTGKTVYRR